MRTTKSFEGFTLVELLVTISIVAILASIAFPAYIDFVTRSNRTEAQRELLRLANLQEQFYVDNRKYTEDMKKLGLSADPFITESNLYSIDAAVKNGGFVLTATALEPQKSDDVNCKKLSVSETGEKLPVTACWE